MTNAQLHADRAVAAKIRPQDTQAEFKLKRFQNVEPRTSTKRGQQGYMINARRVASSPLSGAIADAYDLTQPPAAQ